MNYLSFLQSLFCEQLLQVPVFAELSYDIEGPLSCDQVDESNNVGVIEFAQDVDFGDYLISKVAISIEQSQIHLLDGHDFLCANVLPLEDLAICPLSETVLFVVLV